MKSIALLTCLFCICTLSLAQDGQNCFDSQKFSPSTKTEKEIMASICGRLKAVLQNDTAAWANFVDDNMLGPLEGNARSKQAWIKTHNSWPREVKYFYGPLEDIKIRIHGDTAVVGYHSDQLTEIAGQTTSVHKWQIETLMLKKAHWLLVGVADGLIPREPVEAKVDPGLYDAYAGQYEWAPTLVSTITREGDKLMEQFAGQEKSELSPENETTFFTKGEAASGDSSRVIFVKDSSGRVTHYIYRIMGATDRIVKKIK